jgi:hypothetical protein
MTDRELIAYLGLSDCDPEKTARYIAGLDPERRAGYERMNEVETELHLWQQGVGPKPPGVIVCREHRRRA